MHTQANISLFLKNLFICHFIYFHLLLCLHPWLLRNFVKELSMLILFTFSHSILSSPPLADMCQCTETTLDKAISSFHIAQESIKKIFFVVFSLYLGTVKNKIQLSKFWRSLRFYSGFPGSSDSKASAYNVGDPGSIPGSGRSPGEGNGNPLQYCLENPMDWGAWSAIVHGAAKSQTWLSDFT